MTLQPDRKPSDSAGNTASPLAPPRIAFGEALGTKDRYLWIQRPRKGTPLLAKSLEVEPRIEVPLLMPWFERILRALAPLERMIIDVRMDRSMVEGLEADAADPETIFSRIAIETVLGAVDRFADGREGPIAEVMIALDPAPRCRFATSCRPNQAAAVIIASVAAALRQPSVPPRRKVMAASPAVLG